MAPNIIKVDFDQLERIAANFQEAADQHRQFQQSLRRQVDTLLEQGWRGRGSGRFGREMHAEVFPASDRLVSALTRASAVALRARDIFMQAEEEASLPFRNGSVTTRPRQHILDGGPKDEALRITGYRKQPNAKLFIVGDNDYKTVNIPVTQVGQVRIGGEAKIGSPIHPNDVFQGNLGDCFFAVSLASVAKHNPHLIRNAITDNGDGSFTVRLFRNDPEKGLVPHEETVTADVAITERYSKKLGKWVPKNAHLYEGDVAATGDKEVWPQVLEKAYGQMIGGGNPVKGHLMMDRGGHAADTLEALSGHPSVSHDADHYSIRQLADMHGKGHAITLDTPESSESDYYKNDVLVNSHGYYVDSVDVRAGTVTLRNPWGYWKEDDSGNVVEDVVVVKHEELGDVFSGINVNPLR